MLLAWPLLGGCHTVGQFHSRIDMSSEPQLLRLGIVGYNYTNRHINTFSVNGAGGGNVAVSSPTSGGGGTTCCVPYVKGVRDLRLTVKWQSGGCYYRVKSTISDEVFDHIHPYFKEAEILVEQPIEDNPKYVEIHFFPDGSIKAFITGSASLPRLKLPKERADRSPYPRCPDDKKPAE